MLPGHRCTSKLSAKTCMRWPAFWTTCSIFRAFQKRNSSFTKRSFRCALSSSARRVRHSSSSAASVIRIPGNMLTRIFAPFFQLDHGKATNEGLGIGLALTRQLVEMHGGTIEAQSAGEGLGSEFIVRLPTVPPPSARSATGAAKSKNGTRDKNSLRILVVDDNRDAADALGKLLTLRGQDVRVAYSALEAIERSIELDPHAVILDIGLPDLDGYEVARRLRKKQFGGALIALTGYGQDSDKERARNAGLNFHLTKPVGLKDVEAVLRKISPHT